jgi:tRNA(adenine34) deaminase
MTSPSNDLHFMQLALEQARAAQSHGEVPVGALVVKEGKVIGVGHNQPIHSNDPTAHAEIVALRAAALAIGNYRLEGCTLYVTLEPCAMCAGAILQARIQNVVYGAVEPKMGAAGSIVNLFSQRQFNHHTSITSGLLAAESNGLLKAFFANRRQIRQATAQPLREDALRTPNECFAAADPTFPESKYLRLGDVLPQWRVHYVDSGPNDAATSVMLVHDIPGWSYRWNTLLHALVDEGHRVLAPDLIGFGRSDKPKKTRSHNLQLHFQCLDAIARLVCPGSRVVVIGQGLGLQLARQWALECSTPIDELIAINPSLEGPMDNCPHPNSGFMAGLDFFTEWGRIQSNDPCTSFATFALESTQSISKHLKSIEATG